MKIFIKWLISGSVLLTVGVAATAAAAQRPDTAGDSPLKALSECRKLADPAQRLPCLEREAAALEAAIASGALTIVDRNRIREARRRVFGWDQLRIPFLQEGNGAEDVLEERITTARALPHDRWQLTLGDGSVWLTTEADTRNPEPKAGDPIVIRRGSLGSFFGKVGRSRELAMRRLR